MARLRNKVTGATVNVPDEKATNLIGYEPVETKSAPKPSSPPKKAAEGTK